MTDIRKMRSKIFILTFNCIICLSVLGTAKQEITPADPEYYGMDSEMGKACFRTCQ